MTNVNDACDARKPRLERASHVRRVDGRADVFGQPALPDSRRLLQLALINHGRLSRSATRQPLASARCRVIRRHSIMTTVGLGTVTPFAVIDARPRRDVSFVTHALLLSRVMSVTMHLVIHVGTAVNISQWRLSTAELEQKRRSRTSER